MLYKDYVKTMNLADVLHQLELACYNGCTVDEYGSLIREILIQIDPDGKRNFLFMEGSE